MDARLKRRQFLQTATAAGLGVGLGLGGGSALRAITPTRADELVVGPDAVRFRPEIEPVVRWIEETPRERILEKAVEELKGGLSYRDLMAGVFLAAIRNIKPRPVGFKFHAVMVVNSAHLLGQSAAAGDRLLPLFWALDNFKGSQLQDIKEGDWTLDRVDESHLPGPTQARGAFAEAMEAWDSDKADAATAALCRSAGAAEVMEAFWRYGIRDQRNIGHKAIFSMQCWRTLQAIGWQHAEPVLRSLAFGILDRQGDSGTDSAGPYAANVENAENVREGWSVGRADAGATKAMLEALRQASSEEAASKAVALLNDGIAPESIWDAVTLSASELLMRNPGIVSLHAMTSANALHFIYGASGDDANRKLALLQAAGWIPLFRERANSEAPITIDAIDPAEPGGTGDEAIASIFETVGTDRAKAAAQVVGYAARGGSLDDVFAGARRMIFSKGRDSHQYKYGAAAWEESQLASDPKWRAPLAAAAMFYVPGSTTPDSPLMTQAREAISRVLGTSG
jgi:hypothetical protein